MLVLVKFWLVVDGDTIPSIHDILLVLILHTSIGVLGVGLHDLIDLAKGGNCVRHGFMYYGCALPGCIAATVSYIHGMCYTLSLAISPHTGVAIHHLFVGITSPRYLVFSSSNTRCQLRMEHAALSHGQLFFT